VVARQLPLRSRVAARVPGVGELHSIRVRRGAPRVECSAKVESIGLFFRAPTCGEPVALGPGRRECIRSAAGAARHGLLGEGLRRRISLRVGRLVFEPDDSVFGVVELPFDPCSALRAPDGAVDRRSIIQDASGREPELHLAVRQRIHERGPAVSSLDRTVGECSSV
jgi:hypothetical protein